MFISHPTPPCGRGQSAPPLIANAMLPLHERRADHTSLAKRLRIMKAIHWLPALTLFAAACSVQPQSQFGSYSTKNGTIHLADGSSLTVYRVKRWDFADGSAPALQLEYEPPVSLGDTAAVRRAAERIWPAFEPYVNGHGVKVGILTATRLKQFGGLPFGPLTTMHHFGLIAEKDSADVWHFKGHPSPLPSGDSSQSGRIIDADGTVLPFSPQRAR